MSQEIPWNDEGRCLYLRWAQFIAPLINLKTGDFPPSPGHIEVAIAATEPNSEWHNALVLLRESWRAWLVAHHPEIALHDSTFIPIGISTFERPVLGGEFLAVFCPAIFPQDSDAWIALAREAKRTEIGDYELYVTDDLLDPGHGQWCLFDHEQSMLIYIEIDTSPSIFAAADSLSGRLNSNSTAVLIRSKAK